MKTIIILTLLMSSSFGYAQFPKENVTSEHIKTQAYDLTHTYNKELGLTGVQFPLFREVVEKYLMRAEKVKDKLEGRKELDALVELQAEETLEMNDILTRVQLKFYKKIKADIQPLKYVGE